MKIVLKQNVEKLGIAGEIKEVKFGFAKNYLIPNKLAVIATEKEITQAKKMQVEIAKRKQEALKTAQESAKQINGKFLKIGMQANEEGILFGSVTAKDISKEIKNQLKLDIDEKIIALASAIKKTGAYQIKLKFAPEVNAEIKITVAKK